MKTPAGIELPDQDNIDVALRLAREKLVEVDPKEAALRLDCTLGETDGGATLAFSFMGDGVTVAVADGTAVFDGGHPVPDFLLVLLLHYVIAEGRFLPGQDRISFAQVPSGAFYLPAFDRGTKARIVKTFGENPDLLGQVAEKVGWERIDQGDLGVEARAFPHVPVAFVIWAADEEFPPDANILFDASIASFLPTEDIAMISRLLVGKACKTAEKIEGDKG
jgi:Domain of unknown function (DUF3786)